MELQHINLDQLKTTTVNVRKKGAKDTDDLVPSIRSLGIIQPLLVRPNCEGFEIVAGQRRYHALLKLADEGVTEPVPCMVMAEGDDAKAIEASLAENIARLPMDEIDQYKAFAALVSKGSEIPEIAAQFGVTERLVTQRLAIANIIGPILTAYRKEEIGAETLRVLTMASKKQQRDWWALYNSDDYAPEGYRLKQWLFGGNSIPTDNAEFDVSDYKGAIISDLFGEEQYFSDPDEFWLLQNQAIAKTKEDYLNDGWSDVIVLDVGAYFPSYDYVDNSKKQGGNVYISVSHDGALTCYEGQLSRTEAKKKLKAQAGATNEENAEKPELTKAMQNYLDLHRHAAVRLELLDHQGLALRLAVAQIIAGSELWQVDADPQKANTDAISASLEGNLAHAKFAEQRQTIRKQLGFDENADETVVPRKQDWDRRVDVYEVFAKLQSLTDEDVLKVLTFVVAETLASGSAMVELLGSLLNVKLADHWKPEDTFFDLFKDKQAINGALKQMGGKTVADAHITSTAKVQKDVMRQYLDGARKPQKAEWMPNYMAFPMKGYTKRGGLDAVNRWSRVKKHVKAA
ncbi:MAG: ParB/RepB/Spo0J family partition protein [Alphaproteobacteria bacterium]